MNFKDALKKVYKSSRNKEQLNNPFIVYSRVFDLIGNSYNDKKKVELFFKIKKKLICLALPPSTEKTGKTKLSACIFGSSKRFFSEERFSDCNV